jgi:hypothetical protein
MKRLDTAVAQNSDNASFLYNAACAYSVVSSVVAEESKERARDYAEKAAALVHQAIDRGYKKYSDVARDPDLQAIRSRTDFPAIPTEYGGVWSQSKDSVSEEVHGLPPEEHLQRMRELTDRGYRPAAISAAAGPSDGPLVTASVWHRPVELVLVLEETELTP